MDQVLVVRRCEPARDLRGHVNRLAHGKRGGGESIAQRLAFEELHDGERRTFMSPELEDGDNVRVRE